MDCQEVSTLLSAYIDDELSAEEKALVERHLPGCPDCPRKLEELRQVVKLTQSLSELSPSPAFSQSLRESVRQEAERFSPQVATKKPTSWWQKVAPKAAVGLAAAAAGVLVLVLSFRTLPQKPTVPKAVTERAAPQYAEPLGKSAEMDELAGRPKPEVGASESDYTEKGVRSKFGNLAIWKEFGQAYKVEDIQRFQAAITRYVTNRVRSQGENTLTLTKSLGVALPPTGADFVALPSYLERAKFNHKPVWIIVLNWQKKDNPALPLNRGRIYVINLKTQEIVFSTVF